MKQFLISIALLLSVVSFAQEVKVARDSDVASKYTLKENGDLFRTVRGNECQVTTKVQSMKVSQHPNDVVVLYYVRAEDGQKNLYGLKNSGSYSSQCPAATKGKLMSDVEKYSVVSSTNTTIVNIALSRYGKLIAWDNNSQVLTSSNIDTYKHNSCYGVKGKSFNTFVAFAITRNNSILKIRGGLNNSNVEVTTDNDFYHDINSFEDKNNVCK